MSLNVSNASTVSGRHVSGNFLLRNWWLARPAWERKEELRAPRQFSNFAFAHWQPFSAVGQASAVGGRVLQLQDWLRGISWPSQDRNLVMKYDEIGRILRNGLTLLLSFIHLGQLNTPCTTPFFLSGTSMKKPVAGQLKKIGKLQVQSVQSSILLCGSKSMATFKHYETLEYIARVLVLDFLTYARLPGLKCSTAWRPDTPLLLSITLQSTPRPIVTVVPECMTNCQYSWDGPSLDFLDKRACHLQTSAKDSTSSGFSFFWFKSWGCKNRCQMPKAKMLPEWELQWSPFQQSSHLFFHHHSSHPLQVLRRPCMGPGR